MLVFFSHTLRGRSPWRRAVAEDDAYRAPRTAQTRRVSLFTTFAAWPDSITTTQASPVAGAYVEDDQYCPDGMLTPK